MKKLLKLIGAGLALLGTICMFFTQVTVKWMSDHQESIAIKALVGGEFKYGGEFTGVGSGLAGYILLGVAALILLAVALVPYFKDHELLSAVISGLAVVCLIVGIILLFLIRRNFAASIGADEWPVVYVGWGAIAGGSLGGLAILSGGISVVLDVLSNQ